VPTGYLYSEAGVWVACQPENGTARIGLTDYRQQSSGDVAFVSFPETGTSVPTGEELAGIETIKVDLQVPAPFDGVVAGVNAALGDTPELISAVASARRTAA
jgi:glycine cleavage system H protein